MSIPALMDQGDPSSRTCRHCNAHKAPHNGVLICTTCDGALNDLIVTHTCPHVPRCTKAG